MARALPLFPVTMVGSWPRPPRVGRALKRFARGELARAELDAVADQAVGALLQVQRETGLDLVTGGELRRDNFYSFVADKLEGVELMSLAQMLDLIEDKEGFRRLLDTLDVPAFAIHNPTCVGRVRRKQPLAVDELRFVQRNTDAPVKVALPGPYLLTRAMWVKEATRSVYPSKEALAEDVVAVLRAECAELAAEGVAFIQLDEPVLTELVFTQGQTRTFMCAALAAKKDPAEELELAVSLVNQVVEGLSPTVRTGLHVCRGNWSQDEATLLQGAYTPLVPILARMNVQQLVLEYATPRAGELMPFGAKELGLGVVNPRTREVESSMAVVERVREALRWMPAEAIFLNPDCGFGTFASRPMNDPGVATRKLAAMVEAARALRQELTQAGDGSSRRARAS